MVANDRLSRRAEPNVVPNPASLGGLVQIGTSISFRAQYVPNEGTRVSPVSARGNAILSDALPAQMVNLLVRHQIAKTRFTYFNPSIAHQDLCSSDAVFERQIPAACQIRAKSVGDSGMASSLAPARSAWPRSLGPHYCAGSFSTRLLP